MISRVPRPPRLRRHHILENISSKTFTPREYQVELLDLSRNRNTIICLGTGSGKTFIAVMLIKELSHQVRDSLSEGGKRTIFLVPTVPLVIQQAKVITDCTDLIVGSYFGESVEDWPNEKWREELEKHQVLVMTADIFKGIIMHGYIAFSTVNLIIFDECHRAVKNHPYCKIMGCLDIVNSKNIPRILGLSASLINNKCKPFQIENEIKLLELVLKSSVETANDLTVLTKYGSQPREYFVEYKQYFKEDSSLIAIFRLLNSALLFLDNLNVSLSDDSLPHPCRQPHRYLIELSHVVMTLGPWCALKAAQLFIEDINAMLEFIYSSDHINYLVLTRTVLFSIVEYCKDLLSNDEMISLIHDAPAKLKELLRLLEQYTLESAPNEENNNTNISALGVCSRSNGKSLQVNSIANELIVKVPEEEHKSYSSNTKYKCRNFVDDNNSLCGLIFVKQRVTAYILSLWLSAISDHYPNLKFISPSYIIGHGKNNSGPRGILMDFQKQEEVLQKFRSHVYNLVVATSVIEEGIDIPKCNLVVCFDPPENYRSYVQSKGRARAVDSLYVLMVNSAEKERYVNYICDFKATEELLLKRCHRADNDMDEPVTEENVDELIEPYMPAKKDGSARVTMSSAIALVNRYCAKLPSDTFTRLTPKWKAEACSTGFQCSIQLPINSPLKKTIVGLSMRNKRLAKMAAALQTCIELHKAGELDDNLLPTGKEAIRCEDIAIEETEIENVLQGPARPGTTKRRLYYFKRVANALKNNLPTSNMPCCLYVFEMKLTCPIPEEQNTRGRKIHDPSETSRGFGILTKTSIPPICSFPVFTRSGEVTVRLKPASSDLKISEEQLRSLSFFHRYTFADVLRLEKYPMIYLPSESDFSFYIVPIRRRKSEEYVIDWHFASVIYKQKEGKPVKVSDEERKKFEFIEHNYHDAVVMPWYRNLDKPQFFYVAEICSYLTPKSDFPDMGYETFEGYYKKKYNIAIMNHNQPLLDVDHTSARLNLLTPRYVNRKGVTLPTSSEQTKKIKRENLQQKQILIPELCSIHPFPASLWRKAVCLPCILYRVNSLLLAEQLRMTVANSISVGMTVLPENFQWPILDFGWTLADVLNAQVVSKVNIQLNNEQLNNKHFISPQNEFSKIGSNNFIENGNASMKREPLKLSDKNDFEIDVFDPAKLDIPDFDDDYLVKHELEEINFKVGVSFCTNDTYSTSIANSDLALSPMKVSWKAISSIDGENILSNAHIRYGSPSNFEDSGWDSEWDTEGDDNTFLTISQHGLGYISAPGTFNMESLSMDLASCRDDDIWDSIDDDSVISDMDLENFPMITKSWYTVDPNNVTTSDSISLKLGLQNDGNQLCESTWLSSCSLQERKQEEFVHSFYPDSESIASISRLKEEKKKEIIFMPSSETSENEQHTLSLFSEVVNAVQVIENYTDGVDVSNEIDCMSYDDEQIAENGSKTFLDISNDEATLAFGELLPNRDSHQSNNDNMYRVKFDDCFDLSQHPGPSPSIILQALTMSNANDGINLERLETVGDSFLKYAITVYLFCSYPDIHEGKLSYLRSKQISNLNLYKLGRKKGLGELMVASKFEPNDNWLPPNYIVPKGFEEALIEYGLPSGYWNLGTLSDLTKMNEEEIRQSVKEKTKTENHINIPCDFSGDYGKDFPLVPYNLLTQHSIPDKSIADCVEALIGAYLVSCGSRGALLFMSWLGLKVLPLNKNNTDNNDYNIQLYGYLVPPPPPLITQTPETDLKLHRLLAGYAAFEEKIGYIFNDKSCLLQAFTHASYYYNTLTDCYQRLEFLGDAVLDYLITRHLYEDPVKHSPGTLTDLRSALVNNTFFASLAVKYDFHKYFKAISPGLFHVINKFVLLKENHSTLEDYQAYYLEEDECEEMEDVEVPKALGDIFESVAGAIYLDSGMSLDAVWRVYYGMMKPEIEYFSTHVPKSPIRELLELEPQTAKFERAEMTLNGKVRVKVDVFGKGQFIGVGRNKRIAKCTAAKRALRELKKIKNV